MMFLTYSSAKLLYFKRKHKLKKNCIAKTNLVSLDFQIQTEL